MDFSFTEEQTLLRDSVAGWLADHYDFDQRRAAVSTPLGRRPETWSAFANDLGLLGATFPEADGGLGGGPLEAMVILEAFGGRLVTEPYLGTAVIGGGFLTAASSPMAREIIAEIIAGRTILAFAWAEPRGRYDLAHLETTARKDGGGWILGGHKSVVVDAPWADRLIVTARTGGGRRERAGVSLFLVDKAAAGVTTRDYPTVDGGRASEVYFEDVAVPGEALLAPEGEALPLVERIVDEAIAGVCAEACGVLRGLHEGTVDYTRQRRQFGAPLSSFQVLQHRMVDMYIQFEQAISMTYMAHIKLSAPEKERAKAISAAKVQIGRSARYIGQQSIQLHGGVGMTMEYKIGHYFKRMTMIESTLGDSDFHLRRLAAQGGLFK